MAAVMIPRGCGDRVDSLYFNLCDLEAVWGIVLEAFAAAGIVFSFVFLVSLLASIPFVKDRNQKSSIALLAAFLVFVTGLFCLTFAFIVGKDFSTCASRRFLFGVLFGGCFSCLLMQSVRLNVLSRCDRAPRAWALCLGALGLWLVEVVINTEWLIITIVRHPLGPLNGTADAGRAASTPCNIYNQDFVMALIYVMTLILAVVVASASVLAGKHSHWKASGAFILLTSFLSVCIWVAWIVMYVFGNAQSREPTWDDPTLAIALVANAWVFTILYAIPEICGLTSSSGSSSNQSEQVYNDVLYPSTGVVGYETILKEQSAHNMYVENKAFTMDEPSQVTSRPAFALIPPATVSSEGKYLASGAQKSDASHRSGSFAQVSKPVSPYSGYTGQMRSSVYQPTEIALITKAVGNGHDVHRTNTRW
ncbi:G-protein coupled receptor family C group 5 member C isoform X2 [Mugil cephalus]|uniref:G-protein coupled receptor family C group 5 member C isoform X2 n=1 Tax=Mugil cephalus TaxID=48193 RepID=UPI001FB7D5C7|nr:G-protein coupled receptor family C group 5 member C isoform X2 [Mugil cephalus]